MGYMRHHAILVTASIAGDLKQIHEAVVRFAEEEGVPAGIVSPVSPVLCNGTQSFTVYPDGSKEGWDESEKGENLRHRVVRYLVSQYYDDGSTSYDWCLVQYGDESGNNLMLSSEASAVAWVDQPE